MEFIVNRTLSAYSPVRTAPGMVLLSDLARIEAGGYKRGCGITISQSSGETQADELIETTRCITCGNTTMKFDQMSQEQWQVVQDLHPSLRLSSERGKRGRPAAVNRRAVLDAVLWVISMDVAWQEVTGKSSLPYQTCHRYFLAWYRSGLLASVLTCLFGRETGAHLLQRAEHRMRRRGSHQYRGSHGGPCELDPPLQAQK